MALRLRLLLLLLSASLAAQDLEPFELTPQWLAKIEALAPEPGDSGESGQRILIFSLATGYQHWAIPHTEAVVRILVKRSGVATCTTTRDIGYFEADQLAGFDAVVLNNTCPERDYRDMFYDVFRKDSTLSESERRARAASLEANLIDYVRKGGGLVLLHGGTTMQLNSMAFSEMTGGSFDYHPPQQPMTLRVADPQHNITTPFSSGSFTLIDEPYFFKNAYAQKAFKPLLAMDAGTLTGVKQPVTDPVRYVSWIKRFGKGRVFVSAPSHNAQAFENPEFLAFLLQGMRYTLGQISANDEPLRD
ncbi:ThuA domain-containing protein [Robiginitalea sp. M366]|uniref:ThuA domain-containing protein n=1 Tax=Robiginitalea aestuariiviva TaxID=3036903 RepID=UPI00240E9943|nr:ThuA domain-containing protein [Robiginitalea aestuariiviva]MDG1573169.1 ThuA domain-containing protein [Robiginitalea aestuariiviva]